MTTATAKKIASSSISRTTAAKPKAIRPQPGPQEKFLASQADIAIYGGAAGGGKSWALLLEPLRHVGKPEFSAVVFRRNTTQVRNPGGLWDESIKLYPEAGGKPAQSVLIWQWQSGAKVKFAHLEHESSKLDWQGAQIPLLCFDELTHFTKSQFFYLLSRNRSMCGVRPYVRATCNPDADSWVAEFVAWWIDQDTGLPIPERSGVVRWFVVLNDVTLWADSADELLDKYGNPDLPIAHEEQIRPKSATFVAARLSDNPALLAADPGYLANLKALPAVEQARLLGGNWKIRPAAGLYFRREWCQIVDAAPAGAQVVRYWDLAATVKTDNNDPDWTVGVKLARDGKTGRFCVLHVVRMRDSPLAVERAIINTASADGHGCRIGLPQDPGKQEKRNRGIWSDNWPAIAPARDQSAETRSRGLVRSLRSVRREMSTSCAALGMRIFSARWKDFRTPRTTTMLMRAAVRSGCSSTTPSGCWIGWRRRW